MISAFPEKSDLEQMVRFALQENLAAIAGGQNLADIVFKLIQWAEAQGRLDDLLQGAWKHNPRNPDLLAFIKSRLHTTPHPQEQAPQTAASPPPPQPSTIIYQHYGDTVMGNKTSGDITASGIQGDNIAIGHGSNVQVDSPTQTPRHAHPFTKSNHTTDLAHCESININPFIVGNVLKPDLFQDRIKQWTNIKSHIERYISGESSECISIVGFRRSGKSSMLEYVKQRISEEFTTTQQIPIVVHLKFKDKRFHKPEGITEILRRSIENTIGRTPWLFEKNLFPEIAWTLHDELQTLQERGHRLFVLIDDFDRISTWLENNIQYWDDDLSAKVEDGLITLITATVHPIDEIYRKFGRSSPFGRIHTTTLGAFEEEDWKALVHNGFGKTQFNLKEDDVILIDELAGKLPFYTQLASELLWIHHDHKYTRTEFARLTEPYFTSLWRDLSQQERYVLHHCAKEIGLDSLQATIIQNLQNHGLIKTNGSLFSSIFTQFVLSQDLTEED